MIATLWMFYRNNIAGRNEMKLTSIIAMTHIHDPPSRRRYDTINSMLPGTFTTMERMSAEAIVSTGTGGGNCGRRLPSTSPSIWSKRLTCQATGNFFSWMSCRISARCHPRRSRHFPRECSVVDGTQVNNNFCRNYIFGYHPHGIMASGSFINFGTEGTGFSKLFPGRFLCNV